MSKKEKHVVITKNPQIFDEYFKLPFKFNGEYIYYKVFSRLEKAIEFAEIEAQIYHKNLGIKIPIELEQDVEIPLLNNIIGYSVTCNNKNWIVQQNPAWV
jgi:hypothetical protein